jgi:hypothetical protein
MTATPISASGELTVTFSIYQGNCPSPRSRYCPTRDNIWSNQITATDSFPRRDVHGPQVTFSTASKSPATLYRCPPKPTGLCKSGARLLCERGRLYGISLFSFRLQAAALNCRLRPRVASKALCHSTAAALPRRIQHRSMGPQRKTPTRSQDGLLGLTRREHRPHEPQRR